MSAVKVALQHAQKNGRRKNSEAMSVEVSPDSKCPICLDVFHNISYLDRCLHKFCFRCILEWSKNKAECPLCKQPFNSIYHSIKSEQDFQKYELKQQVENSSFGYFEGVRFRYRTTLTGVHRQMRGRTSPPPDNGVMFEASVNPPLQRQDRYIRRMMSRLAARRRAESEGRMVNTVREQEMVNFRRELYRQGVRVRSVRDGGRSRDTSAEFYRRNPACLHRLVPWLKRELTVLYGAHGSLVNIVQHIIMSRITRYDMEDGVIQEELRPFLQARTEHFLHEFISFAKSPFNMEAYDQHAVYDCPAPSSNEDSNSNSSVIAISEEEENLVEMEQPGGSSSSLSQSVWDDETPGPSYSTTADPGRISHLSVHDSDSESSSEGDVQEFRAPQHPVSPSNQIDMTQENCNDEDRQSSDSDDCVIIGFVKPTKERTPELVQLSSDSDESLVEDAVALQPKHIRFPSCSPAASLRSERSVSIGAENQRNDQYANSNEECGSSKSSRCKTSRKSHKKETGRRHYSEKQPRERYRSKDKEHRRQRRSKSGEHRQSSRSPDVSHSHSIKESYSYISKAFYKHDRRYKDRGSDYYYQSYNHHRHETGCTRKQANYHSSHKYSEKPARSRSRSPGRETRRRDGRRSWSRTSSSSCSPSPRRKTHRDKPGGKRKYKTRHLEEPYPQGHHSQEEDDDSVLTAQKTKAREKRHKKSKERQRKNSSSVEPTEQRKHHKKKKKHKKKSRRQRSDEHKNTYLPSVIVMGSKNETLAKNRQVFSTDEEKDTCSPAVNPLDSDSID